MKMLVIKSRKIRTCKRITKEPLVDSNNSLAAFVCVEKRDVVLDIGKIAGKILQIKEKFGSENVSIVPFGHLSYDLAEEKDAREVLYRLWQAIEMHTEYAKTGMCVFGEDKSLLLEIDEGDLVKFFSFEGSRNKGALLFNGLYSEDNNFDNYMETSGHYAAIRRMIYLLREFISRRNPILDVACGSGVALSQLKELRFERLNGNDLSLNAIIQTGLRQGRINGPYATLTQEEAAALPSYKLESMGTVIVCNILGYLQKMEMAIKRWNELLMQKGRIIVIEEWPFIFPPKEIISKRLREIIRPVSPKQIQNSFQRNGLIKVGEELVPIDKKHKLIGQVFEKAPSES